MMSGKKTHHLIATNCKLIANSNFPLKELVGTQKNVFIFYNVTKPRNFQAADKIIILQKGLQMLNFMNCCA